MYSMYVLVVEHAQARSASLLELVHTDGFGWVHRQVETAALMLLLSLHIVYLHLKTEAAVIRRHRPKLPR